MSERTCKACGAAIVRRPDELMCNYRKRKSCCKECATHLTRYQSALTINGGTRPRAEWRTAEKKPCGWCGTAMTPRDTESRFKWNRRQHCDSICAGKNNRRELATTKQCNWCGQQFARRDDEAVTHFRRRICCSLECAHRSRVDSRRQAVRRAFSSGYPSNWGTIVLSIRERDGNQCQMCGATPGKLAHHVHHIDYNKDNVMPDNLITLCHICHMKTNGDRSYWQAYFTTVMAERSEIAA